MLTFEEDNLSLAMSFYRKKPITIQAFQAPCAGSVDTLEGKMLFAKGDYIIQGVKGELYPCREDIFWATYEKVD